MSYVRDPCDTDEPPCFCDQGVGPVLTTAEFCPACGDPDKPVTEPEGNEDELAYAECEGCTCCSREGCHRGPDSECPYSDAMLSFLCPCTED